VGRQSRAEAEQPLFFWQWGGCTDGGELHGPLAALPTVALPAQLLFSPQRLPIRPLTVQGSGVISVVVFGLWGNFTLQQNSRYLSCLLIFAGFGRDFRGGVWPVGQLYELGGHAVPGRGLGLS